MSFNSTQYLLFLPLVFLAFHYWRGSTRWLLLLASSLVFYGSLKAPFLLVYLFASAGIAFVAGLRLGGQIDETKKRRLLRLAVVAEVLLLVCAKYLPFLSHNFNQVFGHLGLGIRFPELSPQVSIGVSFFVFQAIGYLVDVYLERESVERHFGYFLLGLAFFPKVLQGPIEKTGALLEQLRRPYAFNYDNVVAGMVIFAGGLFKKLVLADRLALFSDEVFNNLHSYSGLSLVVGVYAYAFQLFLDFSAYTDMAIGSARIFNVRLTPNFDRPYLATSVSDFWRRWHITFSRWILENIFKPLQMSWRNRRTMGTIAALIVAFLVSGIWHGASWTFVAWGLWHGLLLSIGTVWQPLQKKLLARYGLNKNAWIKRLQVAVTFHLVCAGWILFRSATFEDAWYVLGHIGAPAHAPSVRDFLERALLVNQSWRDAAIIVVGCMAVFLGRRFLGDARGGGDLGSWIARRSLPLRWCFYMTIVLAMVGFGVFTSPPFIYYRF